MIANAKVTGFYELYNIFAEKIGVIIMKKVLGIGNALTDILLQISGDMVLHELNLPKGSMQLVNKKKSDGISSYFATHSRSMVSGGSAANTINGLTRLGTEAGLIGKIGKDDVGRFYLEDCKNNGVIPHLRESDTMSGRCVVLISPDGERTMCTFLGAATELTADDLTLDDFHRYDIFHVEGYLVQNHALIRRAVQMAKEAGLIVSIDLASYNVVTENLDFLKEIVSEYVDIVFANEDEARAFTSKEPTEALIHFANHTTIAVVKIGKDGSYVKSGEETHTISSFDANCIDTTGAGDLYAAGFLYGLSNNLPLDICGKIGALVSANVVEVIGAKLSREVWDDIAHKIKGFV